MAGMRVPRPLVSFVLAVVIGAGSVAAAGAGFGSDGQGSGDATLFRVPELHSGDRGRYVSGEYELLFNFTTEDWVDADGVPQRVLTLAQERTDRMVRVRGWFWAEPEQAKVWLVNGAVAAGMRTVGGGYSGFGAFAGNATYLFSDANYELFETRFDDSTEPLCGLVHSLQGLEATRLSSFSSPGCPDESKALALTSTPSSGAADSMTNATFANDHARVVVDARFPVPTLVEFGGRTWELTAFQRGQAPAEPLVTGSPLPISYTAGRQPDETGFQHPFPLSEALDFALEGPTPNPLRTTMEDRPGAYLADASFTELMEDGSRRYIWTVSAFDGHGATTVNITKVGPQADDPPTSLPPQADLLLPPAPVPVVENAPTARREYPDMETVQPRFATLSSLQTRWAATVSPEMQQEGPNAWGFSVVCSTSCAVAETQTWIGLERVRTISSADDVHCGYTDFCDGLRSVIIRDRLQVDETGQSVSRAQSDWESYDRATVRNNPILVHEGRQESPSVGATNDGGLTTASWAFPSAKAVAGFTLVGLLCGLAYQLWPALKSGLLVLLRSSQPAPENAVRAEVRLAIAAAPGIHFHGLRRRTGKAAGTLRHHLRNLEASGTVVALQNGGYKCYFPARGTDRHLLAAAGALKAPSARRMLAGIVQAGRMDMGAAAMSAGLTASTATHHALRLEQAGLVTRSKSGRHVELRPTSFAGVALEAAGTQD